MTKSKLFAYLATPVVGITAGAFLLAMPVSAAPANSKGSVDLSACRAPISSQILASNAAFFGMSTTQLKSTLQTTKPAQLASKQGKTKAQVQAQRLAIKNIFKAGQTTFNTCATTTMQAAGRTQTQIQNRLERIAHRIGHRFHMIHHAKTSAKT